MHVSTTVVAEFFGKQRLITVSEEIPATDYILYYDFKIRVYLIILVQLISVVVLNAYNALFLHALVTLSGETKNLLNMAKNKLFV